MHIIFYIFTSLLYFNSCLSSLRGVEEEFRDSRISRSKNKKSGDGGKNLETAVERSGDGETRS